MKRSEKSNLQILYERERKEQELHIREPKQVHEYAVKAYLSNLYESRAESTTNSRSI